MSRIAAVWFTLLVLGGRTGVLHAASIGSGLGFQTNDVVAFVGGSALVAENSSGILETTLTLAFRGHRLRFRNLAYEGDTVFSRPREVNYPSLGEQLKKTRATVVLVQYGRAEAIAGPARPDEFRTALASLLDEFAGNGVRLILMTSPPFESAPAPLPNLEPRNPVLESYNEAIRGLARQRGLDLIDVATVLKPRGPGLARWTRDGLQLSESGERAVASAVVRGLGFGLLADSVARSQGGVWSNPRVGELRAAVVEKNRLWFGYVRPTNWAFLGGDRTEQLSSRDHRDPKIRWFPSEMEQYVPLIAEAEQRINARVASIDPVPSLQ